MEEEVILVEDSDDSESSNNIEIEDEDMICVVEMNNDVSQVNLSNTRSNSEDFEVLQFDGNKNTGTNDFEMLKNSETFTTDFYNNTNNYPTSLSSSCQNKTSYKEKINRGITYVGFHYGNKKLFKIENGQVVYLLRAKQYTSIDKWENFIQDFSQL